mgnify:CR=1 FL=1
MSLLTLPSATRWKAAAIFSWWLPGTKLDWVAKAGDLWKNSVVSLCLNWIITSIPEVRFCIKQTNDKGIDTIIKGHPVTQLLMNPNPYLSFHSLWSGIIISYFVDGNAYLYKVRSNSGDIKELRYIPHYMMEAVWPEDGSEWISKYRYYVNGKEEYLRKEDIIHFRFGLNPDNMRYGLSPLKAQLRQIAQDNEASTYSSVLLENFGVPGMMVSVNEKDADVGDLADPDSDQSRMFVKLLQSRTIGDDRGKPIFSPVGLKVDKLGYSPEELTLQELVKQPAWRICSAFNINPLVLGLPNENKGTYDNTDQAERQAWNNCIIPMLASFSDTLNQQLFKSEEQYRWQEDQFVYFDSRYIRALQVNLQALIPVLVAAAGGTILTPNEAREALGYQILVDDSEADELRVSQNAGAQAHEDGGDSDGKSKGSQAE